MKNDKIGIFASTLCLIHCMLFPLLFSILPTLEIIHNGLEIILIPLSFILGGMSLFDNIKKHKYYKSILLFILGFILISMTIIFDISELFHWIGIILLVIAHYINYKFIKEKDGCHPHNCKHI